MQEMFQLSTLVEAGKTQEMAVYTAIVGSYDYYDFPPVGHYDRILFTDDPGKLLYSPVELPESWRRLDNARRARFFKMSPHRVLGAYPITLWIDGSVRYSELTDAHRLAQESLQDADIALFRHPDCSCAYTMAAICQELKLDDSGVIQRQVDRYRAEGMPANGGLCMGGIVFRRNTPEVRQFNELWWSEVQSGSRRDQISLAYALWKTGIKHTVIRGHIADHGIFTFCHRNPVGRTVGGA